MPKAEKKFHKLTCANCRKKKEKCDGLYPVCGNCRINKLAKCVYDKPALIAYVQHLERQVAQLQRRLDDRVNELIAVPYEFILRCMANTDYFTRPFPNHLHYITNEGGDEPLTLTILDLKFEELTQSKGLTTPEAMAGEVLKQAFVLFLPLRIADAFHDFTEEQTVDACHLPLLGQVLLLLSRLFCNKVDDLLEIELLALRHKWVTLLASALFEPPTIGLAMACFFQLHIEVHMAGLYTRLWIFLGIAAKTLARVLDHSDNTQRHEWVMYIWDKFLATLMNKKPLMNDIPSCFPDDIDFSVYDIQKVDMCQDGSTVYPENLDTTPLLITFSRVLVVLRDLANDIDRFLPIRNHMLRLMDTIMSQVPPALSERYNGRYLGYYLVCLHVSVGVRIRLLARQFSEHYQTQLRLLLQLFDPAYDRHEFVEMVHLMNLALLFITTYDARVLPVEVRLFLVVRRYWLLLFLLPEMYTLLNNPKFLEYAGSWDNKKNALVAKLHPKPFEFEETVIAVDFFVDFYTNLWVHLARETSYFGPGLREAMEHYVNAPLAVFEREEFADNRLMLEQCLDAIKHQQPYMGSPTGHRVRLKVEDQVVRLQLSPANSLLSADSSAVQSHLLTLAYGPNVEAKGVSRQFKRRQLLHQVQVSQQQNEMLPQIFEQMYPSAKQLESGIFTPPMGLVQTDYNDRQTMELFMMHGFYEEQGTAMESQINDYVQNPARQPWDFNFLELWPQGHQPPPPTYGWTLDSNETLHADKYGRNGY